MIRKTKFSIRDLNSISTRLERIRKKLKSPQMESFQIDLELIKIINKLKLAISLLNKQ
ncbi:MAG: hypothetical protein O3A26_02690 [Proteobacteria bacterium]|jgi:hypothetical protein|nr:hypothetical protein [Pseudomonadota bacterium]MDA0995780.1 hypothetical protein [Pseudomonadota bacterium]